MEESMLDGLITTFRDGGSTTPTVACERSSGSWLVGRLSIGKSCSKRRAPLRGSQQGPPLLARRAGVNPQSPT